MVQHVITEVAERDVSRLVEATMLECGVPTQPLTLPLVSELRLGGDQLLIIQTDDVSRLSQRVFGCHLANPSHHGPLPVLAIVKNEVLARNPSLAMWQLGSTAAILSIIPIDIPLSADDSLTIARSLRRIVAAWHGDP